MPEILIFVLFLDMVLVYEIIIEVQVLKNMCDDVTTYYNALS